jgi:dihydropteroate synthase
VLLDKLQAIEEKLGRVRNIEKGPRTIDLDVLLYRHLQLNHERLVIPHPGIAEREFVLRPLNEYVVLLHKKYWLTTSGSIIPPETSIPGAEKSLYTMLSRQTKASGELKTFTYNSLGPGLPVLRRTDPKRRTMIMAVLNTTPDSFSDGGVHKPLDVDHLSSTVNSFIAEGAGIIDIGGQSSRPNAPDVTAEEELERILPAIDAIKASKNSSKVAISVDTYRAHVAEEAVKAGANIINDISAGMLDPDMLPTIARLGCTYVMMHMRGTPATMQDEQNCVYTPSVNFRVRMELQDRIKAAESAGIRRWRMILDPGIGFSKTPEQNLKLLCSLRRQQGLQRYPWLIGTSRKSFIGKYTGVEEPSERVWGTAATVTAAIKNGADIIRVHDVKEMAQVAKMSDALYRFYGDE